MNGHFIPNTHLDREWTLDFQHTRKMTVDFINDLLAIMDQVPEYCFLLDSQAVPLEDYLEVMPENREKLRQHIQSGRIHAGPWYSALDMNCLGGESIVRNLLWGHVTVEPFGPVMKVGYTPFGWGQISQLPQIYRGFGIDVAFFYRGITEREFPMAEFVWQGADGSELLASRFGAGARYNFYFDVWRKALYDGMPFRIERRFHWQEDGVPFKLCDGDNRYDHGYVMQKDRPIDVEVAQASFRDLLAREREQFGTPEIAFMHGMDTSRPDIREQEILRICQQSLGDGDSLFFSSLPRYAEAIKDNTRGQELPRLVGEARHASLNDYGFAYVANDTISARTRQKALTTQVENALIRRAEPYAAMAMLLGAPWPEKYFDLAWRQFLKCHAHDTLGGCGIDRLEQDATYRLRDTLSVASVISSESLMSVQARIDSAALGEDGVVLTVFNPSTYDRSEVVAAYVDVPRELKMSAFDLRDHAGKPVGFEIAPTGHFDKVFRDHADLALMSFSDEFHIRFRADGVPALGYKTFVLRAGGQEVETRPADRGEFVLENRMLKAAVNPDGTVNLLHKVTGQQFAGLNYFEDGGDVGHAWTFVRPLEDLVVRSRGGSAQCRWITDSAVRQTIEARVTMQIPATTPRSEDREDWRRTSRIGGVSRPMTLTVEYTLDDDADALDVAVRFDNRCQNHRLRAMFPTQVKGVASYAEAPFDVVRRPFRRNEDNPYAHVPELTYPMCRFAGISDGKRNFTLISGGLKEYEVMDDESATLALTLMRAYENGLCTSSGIDLEYRPGELAQATGPHECTYRLYCGPIGSAYVEPFRIADAMHAPMIVAETKARSGDLPMVHGLLELDNPQLIVTGITKAARGDALIIRFFNPGSDEQSGQIVLNGKIKEAVYTDLNETPTGEMLEVIDGKITVTAAAKQIRTIAIRPA
jgi:mannosylglycerate hydrolase